MAEVQKLHMCQSYVRLLLKYMDQTGKELEVVNFKEEKNMPTREENRKMNGIIGKDPEMFEEDLTKAFLTRLLDYHEKADLALGWRIPEHMASECHVHDSICLPTEGLLQDLSNCFKINDSKHLTVEWLKTFEDGRFQLIKSVILLGRQLLDRQRKLIGSEDVSVIHNAQKEVLETMLATTACGEDVKKLAESKRLPFQWGEQARKMQSSLGKVAISEDNAPRRQPGNVLNASYGTEEQEAALFDDPRNVITIVTNKNAATAAAVNEGASQPPSTSWKTGLDLHEEAVSLRRANKEHEANLKCIEAMAYFTKFDGKVNQKDPPSDIHKCMAMNYHGMLRGPSTSKEAQVDREEDVEIRRHVLSHMTENPDPSLTLDKIPIESEAKEIFNDYLCGRLNSQISAGTNFLSMILYGVAGNGKSHFVKCMAGHLNGRVAFFDLDPSSLDSKWRGGSERAVAILFDEARKAAKRLGFALILLDELDTSFETTDDGDDTNSKFRGTLQSKMEGTGDNSNIIVIATTNKLSKLQKYSNLYSRFQFECEIKKPIHSERVAFLRDRLSAMDHEMSEPDFETLATLTQGFTLRKLKNLTNNVDLGINVHLVQTKRWYRVQNPDLPNAVRYFPSGLSHGIRFEFNKKNNMDLVIRPKPNLYFFVFTMLKFFCKNQ